MVKISKNAVIIFFVLAAVALSIHPLLALPELPYKMFLIYAIVFTAAFFLAKDLKLEKRLFTGAVLFVMGAGLLGAGQYVFSFFKHNIMIYGVWLIFGGIALIAFAMAREKFGEGESRETGTINVKTEIAAVTVLGLAAFALRFWDLSGFLPGIWFDEAQNGNEAMSLMAGNKLEVFISRYTHMPAMFFYFAGLSIKLFGFNIFSLRLVSCVLGTLSVIAFYFLAKHILKNWKYALLAAFLLAFSRWHITFSRVAFLGMQTVLFEILFLYFYLKFIENKGVLYAVLSGAILGLSLYTFSAANFLAVFAALHIVYTAVKDLKVFIPAYLKGVFIMAAAALITAGPLLAYAAANKAAFFQRAKDVSIMKDVRDAGNYSPLIKNLKIYSLVFNFEGDYNGRHNLYKRPMLDDIGGVFFIIGLIAVMLSPGSRFIAGLLFLMLVPGIITLTIEAPQTYRIIGVIPAVYLIMAFGIKTAAGLVRVISKNRVSGVVFMAAAAISTAAINFHQYYVLYPKHEGTYMSFSPESNGVARFIRAHIEDYAVLISTADKMYGFYMWEQSVICDFITFGKGKYKYLAEKNGLGPEELAGKKGAIIITRPTDTAAVKSIETQYAGKIARKDVFTNPYSGEEIYSCWFIDRENISTKPGKILYVK